MIRYRPADAEERANARRASEAEQRAQERRQRFFDGLAQAGNMPGLCHHGQRGGYCGACVRDDGGIDDPPQKVVKLG